jgi:hypothetical protein
MKLLIVIRSLLRQRGECALGVRARRSRSASPAAASPSAIGTCKSGYGAAGRIPLGAMA